MKRVRRFPFWTIWTVHQLGDSFITSTFPEMDCSRIQKESMSKSNRMRRIVSQASIRLTSNGGSVTEDMTTDRLNARRGRKHCDKEKIVSRNLVRCNKEMQDTYWH